MGRCSLLVALALIGLAGSAMRVDKECEATLRKKAMTSTTCLRWHVVQKASQGKRILSEESQE